MKQGKRILLATASAVVISLGFGGGAMAADLGGPTYKPAMPIPQARTISGTAGIFGSHSWLDPESCCDVEENPWSVGGEALIDIPLSDRASLQIDQYGEAMLSDQSTSEDYTGGYLAGVHLNTRVRDQYLFGVFGGGGRLHFASTEDDAYNTWLVGVEGQLYRNNTTFYGQVGYTDSDANDFDADNNGHEVMAEAWFLRGVIRHYTNGGNTKLEGELGYASGQNDCSCYASDPTDDVDMIAWGVELEHVIRSFGNDGFVSAYARYQGQYYDEDVTGGTDDDATAHTFMVGIKMDMNQLNPFTRERTGAAVDLPDLNRWIGHSRLVE